MQFDYEEMPVMSPMAMPTKDKGFFAAIFMWIITTRKWRIEKDWNFRLNTMEYMIPKGFVFDGASVPKYFRSWLSPMGVLLMAGLIHDYGYKYARLKWRDGHTSVLHDQKYFDEIFREVAIADNGFKVINFIAYYALRLGGWWAWNGHRKRDEK